MSPTRIVLPVLGAVVAFGVGYVVASRHPADQQPRPAHAFEPRDGARDPVVRGIRDPAPTSAAPAAAADAAPAAASTAPRDILARLAALKVSAKQPKTIRQMLVELENLRALGTAALPALREFLASAQDQDYDSGLGKPGFRDGQVPLDFAVPPSLRLGLLELAKNIGGPLAEELLARELKTTGRGVEAAYIAEALQQIAPDKYRDASLAAARDLLAMPLSSASKNPLDRSDREYLYNILAAAGDRSQVAQAQAQLLLPNGSVDRGALRYLQQTLGEEAVAVAVRAWDDPRVPPTQKEPLARIALNYVGRNDRADQLYQVAINDPAMSPKDRQNLIEDLNQDGFPKPLSPADVPLIQKRLALIDQLAPKATDSVNIAAFAEAKKDLLAMREKALRPPPPKK